MLNAIVTEVCEKMNFVQRYVRFVAEYEDRRFAKISPEEMPDDRFVMSLLKEYNLKSVWHNKYFVCVRDNKTEKYSFCLSLDYKCGFVAAQWNVIYKGSYTGPGLLSLMTKELTNGEKGTSDPCFANLKDAEDIIRKEIEFFFEFRDVFLQTVKDRIYMEIEPMNSVPVETTPLAKKTIRGMDILSLYNKLTEPFPKRRVKQRVSKEEIDFAEICGLLNKAGYETDKTKSSLLQYIALPYKHEEYTFYFRIRINDDHLDDDIWIYHNDEIVFFDSLHYISFKSVKHKDWVDFYFYNYEQLKEAIVVQAQLLLLFADTFLRMAADKA